METGFFNDVTGKLGLTRASKPMLIGMAVILVLAAVAVAHVLSGAAAASDFEIEQAQSPTTDGGVSETISKVFVHVSGEVANPGLYEIECGSRVADAVNAAGGFTDEADESCCNLARVVDDGEHLIIPSKNASETPGNESASTSAEQSSPDAGLVNLNTASAGQLETLPGIGESTARKIIADREANGPYSTVEDLMRVSGIGQKKLEALENLVCV